MRSSGCSHTYTELTNRVDRDRRHWQTEGYVQDSWRLHPRLTLDYGVRFTHSGGYYDTRKSTAGFYEPDWNPNNAPRLYYPVCTTGVPGNQPCAANNQRAVDKANPTVLLPAAFIGNLVPGTGSQINGMVADGYPGMRPGEYFDYSPLVAAPRVGFAWDINGDGKQALRASAGVFYAIPSRGAWEGFVGDPPSSFSRVVQWASLGDIENFATSNIAFVETPIAAEYSGGEQRSLEKSYNVNVTYQRDIGFNTTAEVAYVGAFTYAAGARRISTVRPITCICSPTRAACSTATRWRRISCARNIPAWERSTSGSTSATARVSTSRRLQYNALQLSVQRRLNRGTADGTGLYAGEWRGLDRI